MIAIGVMIRSSSKVSITYANEKFLTFWTAGITCPSTVIVVRGVSLPYQSIAKINGCPDNSFLRPGWLSVMDPLSFKVPSERGLSDLHAS